MRPMSDWVQFRRRAIAVFGFQGLKHVHLVLLAGAFVSERDSEAGLVV